MISYTVNEGGVGVKLLVLQKEPLSIEELLKFTQAKAFDVIDAQNHGKPNEATSRFYELFSTLSVYLRQAYHIPRSRSVLKLEDGGAIIFDAMAIKVAALLLKCHRPRFEYQAPWANMQVNPDDDSLVDERFQQYGALNLRHPKIRNLTGELSKLCRNQDEGFIR